MKRHLLSVFIAGFTAIAVLCPAMVWAHHNPENVVTVGAAISQTGRYAEPAGRFVNAYNLFVDERNAAGGWLGHKIKLVLLDDKSDKQTSIKLYEKLITQDKVDFTLGPYSSGITDATANIIERYKYPTVAPGASSGIIWQKGRKYLFNIAAVAQDYQKGAIHLAKEIGATRVAIIGENSLFPKQSAEGAVAWAKELGLKVVLNETYPKKQTDFTGLLQRIKSKRADAIVSNSYFADAAAQLRQLRELNINVKMFSGTVGPALPRFPKELGDTAEYVLGFSQWEPKPEILKRPGMDKVIAAYEQRYGVKPNYHVGLAYTALQILEAAVLQAKSFDRAAVHQQLRTMTATTIMGPWKVNEANLNSHEGLTFQIQDGQRKIVWPKHLSEASYKLPMPEWKSRPIN